MCSSPSRTMLTHKLMRLLVESRRGRHGLRASGRAVHPLGRTAPFAASFLSVGGAGATVRPRGHTRSLSLAWRMRCVRVCMCALCVYVYVNVCVCPQRSCTLATCPPLGLCVPPRPHRCCSSTQFLNHFSALSEDKLSHVSRDISRLEKVLVLLETKLNRPDADDLAVGSVSAGAGSADGSAGGAPQAVAYDGGAGASPSSGGFPAASAVAGEGAGAGAPAAPGGGDFSAPAAAAAPAVSDDPAYEDYKKMIKVGLPGFVVAHKMRQAGLDPMALGLEF